jgi:hypothetical protein
MESERETERQKRARERETGRERETERERKKTGREGTCCPNTGTLFNDGAARSPSSSSEEASFPAAGGRCGARAAAASSRSLPSAMCRACQVTLVAHSLGDSDGSLSHSFGDTCGSLSSRWRTFCKVVSFQVVSLVAAASRRSWPAAMCRACRRARTASELAWKLIQTKIPCDTERKTETKRERERGRERE